MQQATNTASPSLFGSLSDLRILDLTQMLAGPYCTMVLADQGATVVKIEPPEGDMSRGTGLYRDDDQARLLGGYFQSIDRNKDSVVLDLKTEAGKAAFLIMVQQADIVVESFRAGVMDRLGLSYETLREVNPRLVYGSLRGFGDPRTGASPYRDWPTYDVVAQAMGGIMAITGPDANSPTKIGPGIGDIVPGLFLACGLLAAVHHARRTGQGQMVDVAMIDFDLRAVRAHGGAEFRGRHGAGAGRQPPPLPVPVRPVLRQGRAGRHRRDQGQILRPALPRHRGNGFAGR